MFTAGSVDMIILSSNTMKRMGLTSTLAVAHLETWRHNK
jgi:hypothetical protein